MTHDTLDTEEDKSFSLDNNQTKENKEGNDSSTSDGDNVNTTDNVIQLELTDELKQQETVTAFIFNPETDNLSIALNHKYSERKIASPIECTWPKTIATLTKELQRKEISAEHITMLCDVADNAADKILKLRLNKEAQEEKLGSKSRKLLSLAEEQCQELFVNQYGEP
jgi:ribosome biogenesis protein Tsr3